MSLEEIKELRKRTGIGVVEAKKALEEAGNVEDAIISIKKQIGEKNVRDKVTNEGRVRVAFAPNAVVMQELLCETDFTANTNEFDILLGNIVNGKAKEEDVKELSNKTGETIKLGKGWAYELEGTENASAYVHSGKVAAVVVLKNASEEAARDIAMHIVGANPNWIYDTDVSQEKKDEIAAETRDQMKDKPENVLENIVKGKLNAFYKEKVLANQPFIKEQKKTVNQWLTEKYKDAEIVTFGRIEAGVETQNDTVSKHLRKIAFGSEIFR